MNSLDDLIATYKFENISVSYLKAKQKYTITVSGDVGNNRVKFKTLPMSLTLAIREIISFVIDTFPKKENIE